MKRCFYSDSENDDSEDSHSTAQVKPAGTVRSVTKAVPPKPPSFPTGLVTHVSASSNVTQREAPSSAPTATTVTENYTGKKKSGFMFQLQLAVLYILCCRCVY